MLRSISIFFLLTLSQLLSCIAQQPKKLFDIRFGGSFSDKLFSVAKTNDGGYIAVGWSNSNISSDKSANSRGGNDFWIIKMNSNYQKEWDKTFGGDDRDAGLKIIQSSDGSYLLIGHGRSNIGGDKTSKMGTWDFWVLKLSSTGDKIWDRSYGGLDDDPISDAVQTNDGGYILFGFTLSTTASGHITENTRGGFSDLWYIKIDGNGNLVWQKRVGGDAFEESGEIEKILGTDEYYLTGVTSSSSSGEVGQASRGNIDVWVIKINGTGQIIWERRFGGSGREYETHSTVDSNGNLIVTCQSDSNQGGDKQQNSWNNTNDFWVIKVNPSGNLIWERRFGGDGVDSPAAIEINQNGDIIVGGGSNSGISGNKTQSLRSSNSDMYGESAFDYWIIKLNSNGNLIWDARYGGDVNDMLRSILIEGEEILISGFSNSGISGDKTGSRQSEDPYFGEDYWILKISDKPCQSNLFVSTPDITTSNLIFTASNQIISNSEISIFEKVIFDSGGSIIFQPGFKVDSGKIFIGKIGGCSN